MLVPVGSTPTITLADLYTGSAIPAGCTLVYLSDGVSTTGSERVTFDLDLDAITDHYWWYLSSATGNTITTVASLAPAQPTGGGSGTLTQVEVVGSITIDDSLGLLIRHPAFTTDGFGDMVIRSIPSRDVLATSGSGELCHKTLGMNSVLHPTEATPSVIIGGVGIIGSVTVDNTPETPLFIETALPLPVFGVVGFSEPVEVKGPVDVTGTVSVAGTVSLAPDSKVSIDGEVSVSVDPTTPLPVFLVPRPEAWSLLASALGLNPAEADALWTITNDPAALVWYANSGYAEIQACMRNRSMHALNGNTEGKQPAPALRVRTRPDAWHNRHMYAFASDKRIDDARYNNVRAHVCCDEHQAARFVASDGLYTVTTCVRGSLPPDPADPTKRSELYRTRREAWTIPELPPVLEGIVRLYTAAHPAQVACEYLDAYHPNWAYAGQPRHPTLYPSLMCAHRYLELVADCLWMDRRASEVVVRINVLAEAEAAALPPDVLWFYLQAIHVSGLVVSGHYPKAAFSGWQRPHIASRIMQDAAVRCLTILDPECKWFGSTRILACSEKIGHRHADVINQTGLRNLGPHLNVEEWMNRWYYDPLRIDDFRGMSVEAILHMERVYRSAQHPMFAENTEAQAAEAAAHNAEMHALVGNIEYIIETNYPAEATATTFNILTVTDSSRFSLDIRCSSTSNAEYSIVLWRGLEDEAWTHGNWHIGEEGKLPADGKMATRSTPANADSVVATPSMVNISGYECYLTQGQCLKLTLLRPDAATARFTYLATVRPLSEAYISLDDSPDRKASWAHASPVRYNASAEVHQAWKLVSTTRPVWLAMADYLAEEDAIDLLADATIPEFKADPAGPHAALEEKGPPPAPPGGQDKRSSPGSVAYGAAARVAAKHKRKQAIYTPLDNAAAHDEIGEFKSWTEILLFSRKRQSSEAALTETIRKSGLEEDFSVGHLLVVRRLRPALSRLIGAFLMCEILNNIKLSAAARARLIHDFHLTTRGSRAVLTGDMTDDVSPDGWASTLQSARNRLMHAQNGNRNDGWSLMCQLQRNRSQHALNGNQAAAMPARGEIETKSEGKRVGDDLQQFLLAATGTAFRKPEVKYLDYPSATPGKTALTAMGPLKAPEDGSGKLFETAERRKYATGFYRKKFGLLAPTLYVQTDRWWTTVRELRPGTSSPVSVSVNLSHFHVLSPLDMRNSAGTTNRETGAGAAQYGGFHFIPVRGDGMTPAIANEAKSEVLDTVTGADAPVRNFYYRKQRLAEGFTVADWMSISTMAKTVIHDDMLLGLHLAHLATLLSLHRSLPYPGTGLSRVVADMDQRARNTSTTAWTWWYGAYAGLNIDGGGVDAPITVGGQQPSFCCVSTLEVVPVMERANVITFPYALANSSSSPETFLSWMYMIFGKGAFTTVSTTTTFRSTNASPIVTHYAVNADRLMTPTRTRVYVLMPSLRSDDGVRAGERYYPMFGPSGPNANQRLVVHVPGGPPPAFVPWSPFCRSWMLAPTVQLSAAVRSVVETLDLGHAFNCGLDWCEYTCTSVAPATGTPTAMGLVDPATRIWTRPDGRAWHVFAGPFPLECQDLPGAGLQVGPISFAHISLRGMGLLESRIPWAHVPMNTAWCSDMEYIAEVPLKAMARACLSQVLHSRLSVAMSSTLPLNMGTIALSDAVELGTERSYFYRRGSHLAAKYHDVILTVMSNLLGWCDYECPWGRSFLSNFEPPGGTPSGVSLQADYIYPLDWPTTAPWDTPLTIAPAAGRTVYGTRLKLVSNYQLWLFCEVLPKSMGPPAVWPKAPLLTVAASATQPLWSSDGGVTFVVPMPYTDDAERRLIARNVHVVDPLVVEDEAYNAALGTVGLAWSAVAGRPAMYFWGTSTPYTGLAGRTALPNTVTMANLDTPGGGSKSLFFGYMSIGMNVGSRDSYNYVTDWQPVFGEELRYVGLAWDSAIATPRSLQAWFRETPYSVRAPMAEDRDSRDAVAYEAMTPGATRASRFAKTSNVQA